jgi:hypothetical protein
MLVGWALIAAPVAFGLGTAAGVTGVIVGALVIALALAGTDSTGRGTIPLAAQVVYDRGLAVGLLLSALVFGIGHEIGAMVLFGLSGAVALLVTSITRYSAAS